MTKVPPDWPEISNQLAHQVVLEAWDLAPNIPVRRDAEYLGRHQPRLLFEYRDTLRQRLAESGIAQRLVDGPAAFPDFYERLPYLPRQFMAQLRPRDHRQLARHILNHLDWYLDPRRRSYISLQDYNPAMLLLFFAGLILPLLAWMLGGVFAPVLLICGAVLLTATLVCFGSIGMPPLEQRLAPYRAQIDAINRAEFYYYLRESYADIGEEAGGRVRGLAERLAAQDHAQQQAEETVARLRERRREAGH